jgi:hypothetical protein
MEICDVKHLLEVSTAVLAFIAAVSWFLAAWAGWFSYVHTPIGLIERYVRWQALFNAIAAMCAGAAALMQLTVSAYMPVCRAFG